MSFLTKPLTSVIDVATESSLLIEPWLNWIARQSAKPWVLPHAERRFTCINSHNVTVFVSPVLPVWLTRLLRERLLSEGWPVPRYLLTTGSIFKRSSDHFISIKNELAFFLHSGVKGKSAKATNEWIKQILQECAVQNRVVQFVPLIFLWNRSPERTFYHPLYGFLLHKKHNVISTGLPLTIEPGITPQIPSPSVIRRSMLAAWNQESRVITGDKKASVQKTIESIQSEPVLSEMLKTMAKQGKDSLPTLHSRVSAYVREIAADYSYYSPRIWEKPLLPFLKNNFSSLDFDHDGLDELRSLLRKREIVIITPTHRSHLDYILISHAIYKQGLACPLVAAGQNLSFWPMGYFFRKTGAFFIRRTFKGLDIYPHVFRSYLWMILRKFQPVEFFIEGGRSRTGTLLPAKLGMLNMIIEAFTSGKLGDVKFVPLSVNYDRILEEDSYVRELMGTPKQSERITSLLKSRHLLKRHFGKVCFAIGKPVSLSETLKNTCSQNEQKDTIGLTIMNRLRLTMPITSTALIATVMMALDYRETISTAVLLERAKGILQILRSTHPEATVARECTDSDLLDDVLSSAVDRMSSFKNILPISEHSQWALNHKRRFQVDYLRNSIMGLILAPALASIHDDLKDKAFLFKVLSPGIHPFPTEILCEEYKKSLSLLPDWSNEITGLLSRTVLPTKILIETMQTLLVSENADLKSLTTRQWNTLLRTLEKNEFTACHPEIFSKSFSITLFKAFRSAAQSEHRGVMS
jgi:1-acyl-sn-glycerol-3-phosphate acyltransferase